MPDDRVPFSLYEQDLDAWANSQALALRMAGEAVAVGGATVPAALLAVDWSNLAEEIEGLARKDRRELESRLGVVIEHLVKLEFSPSAHPRAGWIRTIKRERIQIEKILRDSPSLRRELPGMVLNASAASVDLAADELNSFGETPQASAARNSRSVQAYTEDQILSDWLPPAP